ncbi:transcriptional regulator [Hahella ganghwensis]|uniref:transcriptional regulator n=1 Tax=Hahella ganghwensis TaxID=286420 RepID=UPI0003755496|nr:transcriptional regulator [Hahella ganghwensis]
MEDTDRQSVYNFIFFTNVLRILDERHMTKNELADRSGVSVSFLSDLTTGKANPSLKVMEAIAAALEVSLPLLLESTDLDRETLEALAGGRVHTSLPTGFERVSVVLPEYRAFQVKKWGEETQKKLRKISPPPNAHK